MERLTTDSPNGEIEGILNCARSDGKSVILHYGKLKPFDINEILRPCTDNCKKQKGEKADCTKCVREGNECIVAMLFAVSLQAATLREKVMDLEDEMERREKDEKVK